MNILAGCSRVLAAQRAGETSAAPQDRSMFHVGLVVTSVTELLLSGAYMPGVRRGTRSSPTLIFIVTSPPK